MDDLILKRMKRRHLRDDAIAFCETARKQRPNITFGADIIAGFPTETEAHFANSLKLVEECDPSESRPNFKRSTNQQLTVDTNRNMTLETKAIDDDHNRGGYFAYPNEREITEERTYEGNIKSVFQGETERL